MKDNWAGVGLAWGWRGVGVGLAWGWCGAGVGLVWGAKPKESALQGFNFDS
jgi:hypothetical protein